MEGCHKAGGFNLCSEATLLFLMADFVDKK